MCLSERGIRKSVRTSSSRLASRRALVYEYATRRYYELRFSGVADDVLRSRSRASRCSNWVPVRDAAKRFAAVYDNLRSVNPEDWSNAVHSCRRILQDLADAVFPPTDQTRTKIVDGRELTICLGKQHFINRILAFVEDSTSSGRFQAIVGSQLAFLGDRLDSVFRAAQKGSHGTIVTKEEADRYVIYTYLIVGDILSLRQKKTEHSPRTQSSAAHGAEEGRGHRHRRLHQLLRRQERPGQAGDRSGEEQLHRREPRARPEGHAGARESGHRRADHPARAHQADAHRGCGHGLLRVKRLSGRYPRLQILTIAELLAGKKIEFPEHRVETFAKAGRKTKTEQEEMF